MGGTQSVSKPLEEWSAQNIIQDGLNQIGPKYAAYEETIIENGVDGAFLASLLLDDEEGSDALLDETLDDLEITNRLHRRILKTKLASLSRESRLRKQQPQSPQCQPQQQRSSDGSMTFNTSDSTLSTTQQSSTSQQDDEINNDKEDQRQRAGGDVDDRAVPSKAIVTNTTDEYMSESDLKLFDNIVSQVITRASDDVFYIGIHLITEQGQLLLSGTIRSSTSSNDMIPRWHYQPHSKSLCSDFVRNKTSQTYLEKKIPSKGFVYHGHIIHDSTADDGRQKTKRVGAICFLEKMMSQTEASSSQGPFNTSADDSSNSTICSSIEGRSSGSGEETDNNSNELQQMMREMASSVERQMDEQRALLKRTASLQSQIKSLEEEDPNVAKLFMNVMKPAEAALPTIKYDSSKLSQFQNGRATATQLKHLPDDFFALHDQFGLPHPPIAKDDDRSIAIVEDMNLHAIQPDSVTGKRLIGFITMAAKLTGCPICTLNFHDHRMEYGIGRPIIEESEIEPMLTSAGINVTQRAADGKPFSYGCARAPAMCNYTLFLKRSFVVPDIAEDATFRIVTELSGARFYAATPLMAGDGATVLATLCIVDKRPRHDFNQKHLAQLEQSAFMVLQELQTWSMWNKVLELEKTRTKLLSVVTKAQPPFGEATIVRTDIMGSTKLWENDPIAMQSALEIHDKILRDCLMRYNGYEIDTAGDSFNLAFHDPVDAIAFCLEVQHSLHKTDWSENILKYPEAGDDGSSFRGLRVRMGVMHGAVTTTQDEITRRTLYSGMTCYLAKSLEDMTHGGQIVTTLDTWNLASSLGEKGVGKYQVLDLGKHVLCKGSAANEGIVAKDIVQLVPQELSYDYFLGRRAATAPELFESFSDFVNNYSVVNPNGRQFPCIRANQIGPSFHDAPYKNNEVTIMFISTGALEEELKHEYTEIRSTLTRLISETLVSSNRGYHCKNMMMAFDNPTDAIRFSFMYLNKLLEYDEHYSNDRHAHVENSSHAMSPSQSKTRLKLRLSENVQFGCVHGQFASMGPHKTTGRAEYLGPVVNRAARVAATALPGTIYYGTTDDVTQPFSLGNDIQLSLVGSKALRGIQDEIMLYSCQPYSSNSELIPNTHAKVPWQ